MVGRMIDLHAHILPALDRGPATLAESIGMARAAAAVATLRNALSLEGIQLEGKREARSRWTGSSSSTTRSWGASPSAERTTCFSSALTVAGRSTSPRRLFRRT